ncbi:polymeric immunoglobulin receptor-like [Pimephales promelas]|uniref:polymeric immunoglobulin receptor-like n=1 Tax=Pimephales promelas TaxID=90988 RepID=UPI001955EBDC|nr:polymeric immunoglobulin receptor-like [Pimephales promelas]
MKTAVLIFITLCLISGQVLCFCVFGCPGGSVMFKCMYKNESKTDDPHKEKYFCKDRSCKMAIISTDIQSRWVYKGRFALYDDENSRFFTVFIRNLTIEDEWEYICGNNQTWSRNVKLVVSRNESRCGKSVIRERYLGQKKITFHCEYDEKFKTHTKVFYRLNNDTVHVLNSSQSSQSSEEKFILYDSHKDYFNVTIRDISAADGGVYLCGVERDESAHRPSETSVTHITFIKEIQQNVNSKITSVQVQAYSSKSVFINCRFQQTLRRNKKFIQKDSQKKIFVDKHNQWSRHDKVHMYDDPSEGRLKVFISDLTAADEATYRCGVNINDDEDLFSEIKLTVNQVDHFPASSKASAIIGESVKLTCNFSKNHDKTKLKHICKENQQKICESISSSEKKRFEFSASKAGVFTVSISNVSVRDAGVYWCGAKTRHTNLTSVSLTNQHQLTLTKSTTHQGEDLVNSDSTMILAVSVGLALLAVCLVLMLLKIKYSCKHGIISSSDKRETGDHEMVQDSDPSSTPLYSTVQLPTIPSDSQNPLYSTVQLPIIPSDLQNPLYSTVQLPTMPSDGLLYASVSFQNHEESLSDAKVVFRKNEIHSDYASVKHSNTPNDYYY